MSLSIGVSSATIGGQSTSTVRALSDATADTAAKALGSQNSDTGQVRTGAIGLGETAPAKDDSQAADSTSLTVKILLKRLKELQQQLREQQQQLAQAQAASYPTPEAKTAVVTAMQGQVVQTNGAILEVSGSLIKELSKGSGSGSVVNTTA
jgi:hypothetical protein